MNITRKQVLKQNDQVISLFTMTNQNGMSVSLLDYGLTITHLKVPDRNAQPLDIVLGYQNLEDYRENCYYFGATIGRFCNRIGKGKFQFAGKDYQLEQNDNENHLHGGSHGFAFRIWQSECRENSLLFRLASPDGDAGYPGDLSCEVSFALTEDNQLEICYRATSQTAAFANFTNHSYFNLAGHAADSILDQELQIHASAITEIDSSLIPTGKLLAVTGTPFDFNQAKKIGKDICEPHEQLNIAGGYDHNFVLDHTVEQQIIAYSARSGIEMSLATTCPGVQLYTGNFLDERKTEKSGSACRKHSAFCLETQYFPDAVNHRNFALPLIDPKHPFCEKTVYSFAVRTE